MTTHLPGLLLAVLGLLAPAQDGGADAADGEALTLLRLYEGDILWGSIEGHDAEGLSIRRLDNGGRVRLPWARLDPAQSEELQQLYGYVDTSGEELLIEADRLVLDNGMEWVGRIVNRTDDEIWIKTASALVPVPKLRLRGAATIVQVPALDVYTGEELYQQELARVDLSSAAGHLELAKFCERVLEFERALEHFAAAQELAPSFEADEIAARAARVTVKAGQKAEIEHLREVDRLRGRGKYDQALTQAQSFVELFPQSSLRADAVRKGQQVEKARERALRARTVRSWHQWAARITRNKARDPEVGLEGALDWLEDGLREELLSAVHAELARVISPSVTPEEVERFWVERDDRGRNHKASYGGGTWLLGADAARAGIPEEARDTSKMSEKELERARLEERVSRYLANQSAVRKTKIDGDEESEQSKAWSEMSAAYKAQWMLAYYAEKGGDMRVVRVLVTSCTDCGGSGVREVVNLSSGSSRSGNNQSSGNRVDKVACPLCHNVGVVRRVVYR